jgi:hypothetical protein
MRPIRSSRQQAQRRTNVAYDDSPLRVVYRHDEAARAARDRRMRARARRRHGWACRRPAGWRMRWSSERRADRQRFAQKCSRFAGLATLIRARRRVAGRARGRSQRLRRRRPDGRTRNERCGDHRPREYLIRWHAAHLSRFGRRAAVPQDSIASSFIASLERILDSADRRLSNSCHL